MNPIVLSVVSAFVHAVLGSELFTRVEAAVHRWADKQISGAEKRGGVLAECEEVGIRAAEWVLRLAIEVAVGKMKNFETEKNLS